MTSLSEYFNDTWDISMSVLPDFGAENRSGIYSTPKLDIDKNKSNTFFGLPPYVKGLIQKYKGIEKLYEWQENCLTLPAIANRKNLIYSLPTSGGKTLVAEILMLKELLNNRRNVIFVLPYVALAQEKVRSLAPLGLDLEFYVEEYVGSKGRYPPLKHYKKRSIFVCTIEKAAALIESLLETKRLYELGMLVVDEIHLIGEPSRGPILEIMLSKLMFVKKNIHIIAMSATIGNLNEIGQFLNAEVYTHDFRPIELTEYLKCDNEILKISRDQTGTPSFSLVRTLSSQCSEEIKKLDPANLGSLVREVIPNDSCLVFCPTKNQCSHFAKIICKTLNPISFTNVKVVDKKSLIRALREEGQGKICPVLKSTIPCGVAYHHSGLTNAERKLLEEAFISGTISCICCTSTLAAGVNLPAKRVIILSPYVGKDFFKLSTYKQMSGRAGRMGFTNAGESYLLCQKSEMPKITELLESSMDRCDSKLLANNFRHLSMGAIGLGIATKKADLQRLYSVTLKSIQNISECNLSCEEVVDSSLNELQASEAIRERENGEYTLTQMASAALAANLEINEAKQVHSDLLEAVENGLLLSNYLHIFYLVVPYSTLAEINLGRDTIISVYDDMSSDEKKVAERIGITDVCLIQYVRSGKVNRVPEMVWNRFLLSLIIFNLWNKNSIWEVSKKFDVPRGTLHNFLMRTAAFASSLQRFTEALQMEKFECIPVLLQKIIPRISYCCTSELLHLMQLPAVKIGRAQQLYRAGYKKPQDLAVADPISLVAAIDHLPRRVAYEIVAAAKLMMLERAETLQEEAEGIKAELKEVKNNGDASFNGISELPENRMSTPQVKRIRS